MNKDTEMAILAAFILFVMIVAILITLFGCGTQSGGFPQTAAGPTPASVADPCDADSYGLASHDGQHAYRQWSASGDTACCRVDRWHCGEDVATPIVGFTPGSAFPTQTPCGG